MKDDAEAAKPSEGNDSIKKRKSNSGCGGCLFPIIFIALTAYCSFDKSDFYLMPGETNLWSDAMEEVFDNLYQVVPDSLEVNDDLDVFDHTDKYVNKGNLVYGVHPLIRLRSKENAEQEYLMRIIGIVWHQGPDAFTIRSLELDTLININEFKRLRALKEVE